MKENAQHFLFGFFLAVIFLAFIYSFLLVENASEMYLGKDNAAIAQTKVEMPYALVVSVFGRETEIPVAYLKTAQTFLEEHYTLIPTPVRFYYQCKSLLVPKIVELWEKR